MNWIKEVYTMYDDASKFVFGFHSEARQIIKISEGRRLPQKYTSYFNE
jgi:hypothetical protein